MSWIKQSANQNEHTQKKKINTLWWVFCQCYKQWNFIKTKINMIEFVLNITQVYAILNNLMCT